MSCSKTILMIILYLPLFKENEDPMETFTYTTNNQGYKVTLITTSNVHYIAFASQYVTQITLVLRSKGVCFASIH